MRWVLGLLLSCTVIFAAEEETIRPPRSIVRNVLQPLGMPVVSLLHQMKESPFLNMARAEATGLEAAGDFFLAPSRYLFGGKTIAFHQGKYQTTPSFSYERYGWVKTTLSLLAFPVCELLGCTFKAAALLSKDTRHHYRAIYRSIEDTTMISCLDFYRQQGIASFHSDQTASSLGLIRPSVLPKKNTLELKAFKEVCELLNRHNVLFWLDCGSCLGAYRYGGMIPWDVDIDIGILSADHENVKKILSTLDQSRFQIQDWSSRKYPNTFLKLYIKETKTLIDLYHYTIDPESRTVTYFYTFKDSALPERWKKSELMMTKPIPYEVIFPLKKAVFDGISAWVPYQTEEFLHFKYGENLTPTMIWDEKKQAYKKVKDHPYWALIE